MNHVKYAHHIDGEAHFSQAGKIITRVRRRANPLQSYSGHMFTVQLQGLSDFETVKHRDLTKSGRLLVCLRMQSEPTSLKLVAHLYPAAEISRRMVFPIDAGPWIRVVRAGRPYAAVLLAAGNATDNIARILTLSFEEIPQVFTGQSSGLSFMGGFDRPEQAFDHNQDTSFLMLLSPAANPDEALQRFGKSNGIKGRHRRSLGSRNISFWRLS